MGKRLQRSLTEVAKAEAPSGGDALVVPHQYSINPSTQDFLTHLLKNAPADVVQLRTFMQYGDETKYVKVVFDTKTYPERIELLMLTDVQWGHVMCQEARFLAFRDWVLAKPYRFVFFGGDMIDAAHSLSIASPYENKYEPQAQVYRFVEAAMPLRHRILGFVGGNHERRTARMFGDLGKLLASLLRVPYSSGKQLIDVHYGEHTPFKVSLWHGGTGSRTKGAKAQMLHRFMRQGDSQLYMVGHLHDCMVLFDWRERRQGARLVLEKYAGAMSSSFLEYWGCVDDRTEVLTSEGWKNIDLFEDGTEVAAFDLNTSNFVWQPAKKHVYSYTGGLLYFKNNTLDMLVTPNHRVVLYDSTPQAYTIRRADACNGHIAVPQAPMPLPPYTNPGTLTPDMATVLGWFLMYGYYWADGTAGIVQSERTHPRYCKRIRWALIKAGFAFSERRSNGKINFYLSRLEAEKLRTWVPHRLLTARLVLDCSIQAARNLFNALVRSRRLPTKKVEVSWKQGSQVNRGLFQILALRLGFASTASDKSVKARSAPCSRLHAANVKCLPVKDVRIWCLSTPATTFVARRNGRIFVTGNTYAEVAGLDPSDTMMARAILEPDKHWEITLR